MCKSRVSWAAHSAQNASSLSLDSSPIKGASSQASLEKALIESGHKRSQEARLHSRIAVWVDVQERGQLGCPECIIAQHGKLGLKGHELTGERPQALIKASEALCWARFMARVAMNGPGDAVRGARHQEVCPRGRRRWLTHRREGAGPKRYLAPSARQRPRRAYLVEAVDSGPRQPAATADGRSGGLTSSAGAPTCRCGLIG